MIGLRVLHGNIITKAYLTSSKLKVDFGKDAKIGFKDILLEVVNRLEESPGLRKPQTNENVWREIVELKDGRQIEYHFSGVWIGYNTKYNVDEEGATKSIKSVEPLLEGLKLENIYLTKNDCVF